MMSGMEPMHFMDKNDGGLDGSCDQGGMKKIKKDESINIDIKLIMGGGKPPHFGKPDHDKHGDDCDKMDEPDWKSIAKQLLQSVSMMDAHSDGYETGSESAEGALAAIDNETSRVLWGKQDDSNPMSSYQNANYGATTSNGMVMTNPAVTYNNDAYGKLDPDHDGDVDFDDKGDFIDTGKDEIDWDMVCSMLDKAMMSAPQHGDIFAADAKDKPLEKPDPKPEDKNKIPDNKEDNGKNPFGDKKPEDDKDKKKEL